MIHGHSVKTLFFSILCLLTACTRTTAENSVILNISGGTSVTINGKDVSKDVIVTSSTPVPYPVTIPLTIDPDEGEVFLETSHVTINKGETTGSTKITFSAAKFPADSPEKKIGVSASTDNPDIHFNTSATVFSISTTSNPLTPELSITVKEINTNTTDANGTAEILFELNKALSKEITINKTYENGLTVQKEAIKWSEDKITIPKGSSSASVTVTVKEGISGTIPLRFSAPQNDITIKNGQPKLIFTSDPFPAVPAKLCAIIPLYPNAAFTKTFTVGDYTLNPPHNLDGIYGYDDKTDRVTAKITNGGIISVQLQNASASPLDEYALAAWIDWNRSGKLSDTELLFYETLHAPAKGEAATPYTATLKAPEGTPDGKYHMRIGTFSNTGVKLMGGCGSIDSGDLTDITIDFSGATISEASIIADGDTKIFVDDTDITKPFTVARSGNISNSVTINLAVSSTNTDRPTLDRQSVTIPANQNTVQGSITFKAANSETSGLHSEVSVTIVSASDGTASSTENKITYEVSYAVVPTPTPVKLCPFSVLYSNSIYTESFTAGDYTLSPKHNATDKSYGYCDLTGDKEANIGNGDIVSITYGNQNGAPAAYVSAAWVDWNRDGNADNGEAIIYKEWNSSSNIINGIVGTLTGTLKAPAGTKAGSYIMRIGTSAKRNLTGGCGKVENADMFDIRINYTE